MVRYSNSTKNFNRNLENYLQEINKWNLLSQEEEIELARKIKEGDEFAANKLVTANLRFVVSVARQFVNQGLSLGDLINEGNIGLIKAACKFDETRGFKFISYAVWWIRQGIMQSIADNSRVVRLPTNKFGNIAKLGKAHNRLEQNFEREPTIEELAEVMKLTVKEVSDTMKHSARYLSIDAPMFDNEDGNSLLDIIPGSMERPDNHILTESIKSEIDRVLNSLSVREAKIIKLYFGIDSHKAMTLEEIGREIGLTKERVRQIKERGIKKLRHASRSKILKHFVNI
ncbi:MAG: RNA polymerase sigma factor RpoD/SigA [Calditrichaeota bacterium]|nr:MAG: RNA polymerase sigma factor RpoD/SigA [Calditrichota bacterium]